MINLNNISPNIKNHYYDIETGEIFYRDNLTILNIFPENGFYQLGDVIIHTTDLDSLLDHYLAKCDK